MASSFGSSADWYAPLDADLVRQQLESFQQLEKQLAQEWDEETAKYEQLMTVSVPNKRGKSVNQQVPRRNYANPEGKIQDPSLYPYDKSMYPLLDAYDALYLPDMQKQPIPANSVPPCLLPMERRHYAGLVDENEYEDEDLVPDVESHTPVSVQCLGQTLVQKKFHCCSYETLNYTMQRALDVNQEFFNAPLDAMTAQAALQGDNAFYAAAAQSELVESNEVLWINDQYGHDRLPFSRPLRGSILLKLLKHSLSELQRDDRLAAAVSVLLARHHDLDDTSLLARFLVTLCSEHIPCDGECEWEEGRLATHYCMERQNLDAMMPQILAFGITVLKEEHVNVLAGFVRYTFHREFGHLMDAIEENADMEEKRNRMLKRTAFVRRMEGEDEDVEGGSKVPLELISSVIRGLGVRGSLERHRLKAVQSDSNATTEVVSLALETYINCIRALVDIAEACLLYLPVVDRFYALASEIVKNLACLLIDSTEPLVKPVDEEDWHDEEAVSGEYFGSRDFNLKATGMSAPTRLADCISNATVLLKRLEQPMPSENADAREILFSKIKQVCFGRPPDDVRDVVRALFLREYVDVREACLGYADFLLWCRFPYDVTPHDPVVTAYGTNFPVEADDSDDESEDDDDESDDSSATGEAGVMYWASDEESHVLTRGELRARYDFSLLLLFRAWNAPWNPSSHLSFQPQFRQAAKCVMMCTHHLSMPKDVGLRIVEFMARDFWPDDRNQCYSFECPEATKNILKRVEGDRLATTSLPEAVAPCPTCKIAVYCCSSCKKTDWKEDHKRFCNAPPFRHIGRDERRFIASVLGEEFDAAQESHVTIEAVSNGDAMDVDGQDAAEADDDWSDIDSDADEDAELSQTKQIYKYFNERTYTPRGIDD